jgi:hypothetical protein
MALGAALGYRLRAEAGNGAACATTMELETPQPRQDLPPGGRPPNRTSASLAGVTALLAIVALATFVYPMFVIRPFRAQGPTELAVALAIKQAAVWVTVCCTIAALVFLAKFWTRSRVAARVAAIVFTILACGSIWLARFNLFEKMFHPMGAPAVEPAAIAKIDPDDMVIAVKLNGSARAYPIREMGYHHIANDWVGGEPIVATY